MGIKSIVTRDNLKDVTFERLGLQFRRVIVTEEQLDIIVDTTLQKFFEDGDFGTEERFIKWGVVQGQQDYALPYEIAAVVDIVAADNLLDFFSLERTIVDATVMQRPSQLRLLDVEMSRQYLQTVRKQLLKQVSFEFNSISRRLHIFETPKVTKDIILHIYRSLDESDQTLNFGNIYGHPWVKEYVYALCMIQIADNIAMYGDTPLPNGIKVNYQYFLDRGYKIKDQLDIDLIVKYSAPFAFFVG